MWAERDSNRSAKAPASDSGAFESNGRLNVPARALTAARTDRRSKASQCRGAARNGLNSGNPEVLSGLAMAGTPIRYRGHEEHGSGQN
jgi:hypothetical protein